MKRIDLTDKKIISRLSLNSRASLKEVSEFTHLSKNSVNYRINRLLKEKYITHFMPFLDYSKIGYSTFDLFVKVRIRKEDEKMFEDYFKNNPNVLWAITLFGEWDFMVQYCTKNFYQFYHGPLQEFLLQFKDYVEDYDIKVAVKRLKFDLSLPDTKFKQKSQIKIKTKKEKQRKKQDDEEIIELDGLDQKILHQLSQDSRMSFQEIGRKINEPLETVRYRFNKLKNKGVLVGFSANINYERLGYTNYLSFIRLQALTEEKESKLINFLDSKKEIIFALKNGNVPEIYLQMVCKNPYLAESLIKEINELFFEQIKGITNFTITKEIKVEMFPKGLLEEK